MRWLVGAYARLMIADRRVHLLRHCRSAVDPTREPSTWGLTEDGAADADRLAQSSIFSTTTVVAAGDEPKMVETLRPLADRRGIELIVRAGLGESTHGGWVSDEDFEPIVRRFLEEPDTPPASGWESAANTADRFMVELDALAVAQPSGDIAVCTGGRALTATLVRLGLVRTEQALEAWAALQMPDIVTVAFDANGEPALPPSAGIETVTEPGGDGRP